MLTSAARLGLDFHRFMTVAALLMATAGSTAAAEPVADPLAQLKPGEWWEVPNSQLKSVAASAEKFPWLSGGIEGITTCWSGGAFDSQRDRLYLGPGGGHAGYNGNEVYAFDLNEMKWRRLNDPDPVIPGTEYTDLKVAPFAMHTYDGVDYLPPPTDRYVVVGGWGTPRTYAMNPDHPEKWEVHADHGTGRTGDISAVDPNTGLLWLSTPITAGKLSQWNPIAHRWTLRTNDSPDPSYYETADVDSKRSLLVSCGKGKVKTWKLAPIPQRIEFAELKTSGPTAIVDAPSPGFCYVPLLDKFVGWANGADIYTLDIDAKTWTKYAPAATNKVIPGPADQWGTFGRFRYVPSKNIFILCNAVNQNVYLYRLTADRPNVITGVQAKLRQPAVETDLPAAAIAVEAIYADGARRDVTALASYFSLDPTLATVELHGKGVVRGVAAGTARIRAVYSDPAFQRGFAAEIKLPVKDILAASALESVRASYRKLTIPAGDTFQLQAKAAYVRGQDHFTRPRAAAATWSSDAPEVADIRAGLVTARRAGGPVLLKVALGGKSDTVAVTVTDAPVIQRISFRVQDAPPRAGWLAETGQLFSAARGFGWLATDDLVLRDDRGGGRHPLLKSFVAANEKQFRVKVPAGMYAVRVAMGDADYGAIPFEKWTGLGSEKLLYYEGRGNDVATKVVRADDSGLTFTVNGPINYLIVAPVGVDLEKYAHDGLTEDGK